MGISWSNSYWLFDFLDDELQPALFSAGCETGGSGAQSLAYKCGGNSDFPKLSLWQENKKASITPHCKCCWRSAWAFPPLVSWGFILKYDKSFCNYLIIPVKRDRREDLAFNVWLVDFLATGGGKTAFRMTEAALWLRPQQSYPPRRKVF